MDQCFLKVQQLVATFPPDTHALVAVTGGGAFKYHDKLRELVTDTNIARQDEMACLVSGLDYFISQVPRAVFIYQDERQLFKEHAFGYPYLLVNVGSGVSMIKVSGNGVYERVGGTSLGGGTLYGLLSLLTKARTFPDMLALSKAGDHRNVDMLVGDIYGSDYDKIGLSSDVIASTFGKVFRSPGKHEVAMNHEYSPADIAASLLKMISTNIAQIAYLQSDRHKVDRIYFGGSFIGGHEQTMTALTTAIQFWSQGSKEACFLTHDGYLGALGAYLGTDHERD